MKKHTEKEKHNDNDNDNDNDNEKRYINKLYSRKRTGVSGSEDSQYARSPLVGQRGLGIASIRSEDERCSGARHAGSLLHLLSRALDACRALSALRVVCVGPRRVSFLLSLVSLAFRPAFSFTSLAPGLISVGLGLSLSLCSALVTPAHATAVMHNVQDVLSNYTSELDGRLYFTSPSGQSWEFVTDINDPEIANKGDGLFHPFSSDLVDEALAQVSYPSDKIPFEVFVLPYPRRGILESSAAPGEMFLSPGVLECSAELVHFTVDHELGHVVHRLFMPDDNVELWQRYRELRGITDVSIYNAAAIHKNRPHEIFAEDFRFLFGSALANYSGTIENSSLLLPTQVAGLREFMISLVSGGPATGEEATSLALNSFPNPFNPILNVNFNVGLPPSDLPLSPARAASGSRSGLLQASSAGSNSSARHLVLRVFDVNGRLVRTLLDDELLPGSYSAVWSGTDEQGKMVSSGVYFLRLEVGAQTLTKKVILSR
jgi:hypothetical protein